ncbi:SulP family inorganic anion transporter [Sutcliffiella halmapala]|uniref:SulP family inorganic anion transporter n=1 Tax=Sutcliffiella halmapala TaxID=79882 RepID=UPI000994F779|nr:SulP family inorganic anion transporter [Sutcliffiella halmapala]
MLEKILPGVHRLFHYKSTYFTGDLTSGIIVTILFIPQCIAYAAIAGVPPLLGLYAATFPLLIYSLFASSKYLSVGPVSIVSLMVFTGVSALTPQETSDYISLVLLLGLLIGIIQLLFSMIHIEPLFNIISPAVISGFTSAVAIIIGLNQLEAIMGVELAPYTNLYYFFLEIIKNVSGINSYTLAIGVGSILAILIMNRIFSLSIAPFLIVVVSTFMVFLFQLHQNGVSIIGNIPEGMPSFTFPTLSLSYLKSLLPLALAVAFISFLESYAIAKSLADREENSLNVKQELRGLGLANVTSSFIGAIPVAGAFSRTAVNYKSGAKTNLSSMITVFLILITLLFFTDLLFYLPKSSLAAIVIVAVASLVNLKPIFELGSKPLYGILFTCTFLASLFIGVLSGLLIGIFLSILIVTIRNRIIVYV